MLGIPSSVYRHTIQDHLGANCEGVCFTDVSLMFNCTNPSNFLYITTFTSRVIKLYRINSRKNQVTDFMKGRNLEENMAEGRHIWHLGVNGRLLALYIIIIK